MARKAPRQAAVAATIPGRSPWLVGPAFDLLFLANWAWPLLVALTVLTVQLVPGSGVSTHPGLSFWQIYVLTTPHRWITLALVFLDGERFRQRRGAFVGIALTFLLIIAVVWLSTQTLILLLLVDYVWNAWHYASQHSGISRIYGRAARPDVQTHGWFEKIALRVFVLYTILRLPLWALPVKAPQWEQPAEWPFWVQAIAVGFLDALTALADTFRDLDLIVLMLPAALLIIEFLRMGAASAGRLAYLTSVCLLYGSMLAGVHAGADNRLLLGLFLAISVFHASEYLAIVSWSVWKRHGRRPETLFGHLVPRWGLILAAFMAVLALTAWMMDRHFLRAWLVLTIFVSYLHYAYDGMIWKVRRPQSAAVA